MIKLDRNFQRSLSWGIYTAAIVALLACTWTTVQNAIFDRSFARTLDQQMTSSMEVVQRLIRPPNVTGLAWSSDGSKLATFSNYTSVVTIWGASNWQILREFSRYSGGYGGNAFAWLPNGLLVTPAAAKIKDEEGFSLSLWNADTGTLVKNVSGPEDETSIQHNEAAILAVSPSGSTVAITNYRNRHRIFLFDTESWAISRALTLKDIPTALSFGPDGRLAVGLAGGQLDVYDTVSGTLQRTIIAFPSNRSVSTMAFDPSGLLLAAAPTAASTKRPLDSGPVRIWNANTGERVAVFGSVENDQTFPEIAWSADGSLLVAISFGLLEVWRVEGNENSVFRERSKVGGSAARFSVSGTLAAAEGQEVVILKQSRN